MKFGKRLASEAERGNPAWRPFYLDYKLLKKAIAADVAENDPLGSQFQQHLSRELNKVAAFYTERESEMEQAMVGVAAAPTDASITELRTALCLLRKYVVLSYIAVVKIVKKRNRHLKEACGGESKIVMLKAIDVLSQQHFFTSLELANMITKTDILAADSPTTSVSQVIDQYTCPVCLDLLQSPVVLSCAHLLCWGCLLTHCSTVMSMQATQHQLGGGADIKLLGTSPVDVRMAATWLSDEDSYDEEEEEDIDADNEEEQMATGTASSSCTQATFGCPVCRKEQIVDLDKLQVNPELDAFLAKLQRKQREEGGSSGDDEEEEGMLIDTSILPSPQHQHQEEQATTTCECTDRQHQQDVDMTTEISISAASTLVDTIPSHRRTAPPLLPQQHPRHYGKLTVCLDLDGTLVTTFNPKRAPSLPPFGPPSYVVGKGRQLNPGGVLVVERPGLGEFIQRLAAISEIVIFTAGLEDYAEPILDALEERYGTFEHRLYRPATTASDVYPCVKDLSHLGRLLSRTVLVDDTPLAFYHQPNNGIPILQYRGDCDDRLLTEAVAPMIEALATHPDVRTPLASRFNMRKWFAAQGLSPPDVSRVAASPAVPSTLHRVASAPVFNAMRPTLSGQLSPSAAKATTSVCEDTRLLLVLDFDKTLTDFDAGERICDELAPELTSLLSHMESPANFISTTNSVLAEMQRRGVSRDRLLMTLRSMGKEVPAASVQMLRWAAEQDIDVRILSDCNNVFISHVLTGADIHTCVKDVVTNTASFERVGNSVSGMIRSQHKLVIAPRHDHRAMGSKGPGCSLCPSNLCKGMELDAMRRAHPNARIIYAGDGANDLCPALKLRAGDVVLPRADHALERLIKEREANGKAAECDVLSWATHEDLFSLVRGAVNADNTYSTSTD